MHIRPDQPSDTSFAFDAVHSPASGAASAPVLDRATFSALEELAGDEDPDLVSDLVELFLEDSKVRMEQIEEAASGGDHDSIGRAAHALKSSSANIGALLFSRVCAEIESLSRSSTGADLPGLDDLLSRAASMYAEVRSALRSDS